MSRKRIENINAAKTNKQKTNHISGIQMWFCPHGEAVKAARKDLLKKQRKYFSVQTETETLN